MFEGHKSWAFGRLWSPIQPFSYPMSWLIEVKFSICGIWIMTSDLTSPCLKRRFHRYFTVNPLISSLFCQMMSPEDDGLGCEFLCFSCLFFTNLLKWLSINSYFGLKNSFNFSAPTTALQSVLMTEVLWKSWWDQLRTFWKMYRFSPFSKSWIEFPIGVDRFFPISPPFSWHFT
jgi:hypothetical protein